MGTASPECRVGLIGLGAMGQGIAVNLIKCLQDLGHSHPLLIWNRTEKKADEALSLGAQFAAGGVPEIARTCDVTLCIPFDDAALLEIARQFAEHCKQGACFVSMPTVHPRTTAEASGIVGAAGALFVACPVFGRPDAARKKMLLCAVAGSPEAKATIAPYLAGIGRGTLDLGEDPAAASVQKLVGNFMIVGVIELMAEAMTLGEKSGLSREQFLTFINTFFPAPVITGYATRMAHSDFSTNGGKEGFTVDGGIKDASLVKRLGEDTGVKVPIAEAALDHLLRQSAQGFADKDFASLCEVVRSDANINS